MGFGAQGAGVLGVTATAAPTANTTTVAMAMAMITVYGRSNRSPVLGKLIDFFLHETITHVARGSRTGKLKQHSQIFTRKRSLHVSLRRRVAAILHPST